MEATMRYQFPSPGLLLLYQKFDCVQIAFMAKDMPAMEAWFAVPCPNKFIAIKRSESFLRHSHIELENSLFQLFTNVRDYLKSIGK